MLSKGRYTTEVEAKRFGLPVAAAALLYQGGIVCVNAAGFAVKGATALNLKAVGIAEAEANNVSGADGAMMVQALAGCYKFNNSAAADLITSAEIKDDCFIVDDETVAKTNGAGTRSRAGKIIGVDGDQVLVLIGPQY